MIKPTVGRIVHYWSARADLGQPNAAMIVYVHNDTCVNLAVFDANGNHSGATSVWLHQEGNERPSGQFAEWMPYQKGQAAKTDELEKALAATSSGNQAAPAPEAMR